MTEDGVLHTPYIERAILSRPLGFFIYDGMPDPPLSAEDAAWAQQFVPQPS